MSQSRRSKIHGPPVRDGCEWNPDTGQAAWSHDDHTRLIRASVIVGANGKWRLCASCAALLMFKRYKHKPIAGRSERSRVIAAANALAAAIKQESEWDREDAS